MTPEVFVLVAVAAAVALALAWASRQGAEENPSRRSDYADSWAAYRSGAESRRAERQRARSSRALTLVSVGPVRDHAQSISVGAPETCYYLIVLTDGDREWERPIWGRGSGGRRRFPFSPDDIRSYRGDLGALFAIEEIPAELVPAASDTVGAPGARVVRLKSEAWADTLRAYAKLGTQGAQRKGPPVRGVDARGRDVVELRPERVRVEGTERAAPPPEEPRAVPVTKHRTADRPLPSPKRPDKADDWKDIEVIVRRNRVTALYHFTDRANLPSIVERGGLYSWRYCVDNQIVIARPGGNELSRALDTRKGLEDYVRLSFARETPMMYVAKRDGRLNSPYTLEVDPEVMYWAGTLFSDGNATANSVKVGPGAGGLGHVRFDVLNKRRWEGDAEKHLKQAEVLVLRHLPAEYIRNLPK